NAISCFVNRDVERHHLIDTTDIMSKTIDEGGTIIKQTDKLRHVMSVPGSLEHRRCLLWRVYPGHRLSPVLYRARTRRPVVPIKAYAPEGNQDLPRDTAPANH